MFQPYRQAQKVWGHDLDFQMDSPKSESWYGGGWHGDWNPELRAIIQPGDVVYDVGANEGWTTVVFARHVGPTGHVVAIEADSRNVDRLHANVQQNGLPNVTIVHAIASDVSGQYETLGAERLRCTTVPDLQSVKTLRLDALTPTPNVMKLDVEGWELPVLRGAAGHLEKHPVLEIEMHLSLTTGVHMTKEYGFDPMDIIRLLRGYGYELVQHGRLLGSALPVEGLLYAT